MKKLIVAVALLFATSGVASALGIKDSVHDLTKRTDLTNTPTGICEPCHTPHTGKGGQLLWNRAASSNGYNNSLQTIFQTSWGLPSGTSILCLGCHDGTIAIDSYGDFTNGSKKLTSLLSGSNTLEGNHPISVNYKAATVPTTGPYAWDAQFKPIATASQQVRFYGSTTDEAIAKVECGSCHDVHAGTSYPKLLRVDEKDICQACHNK